MTLLLAGIPASLSAQTFGDIRGHIAPDDHRTAYYLDAYPETDQATFEAQQAEVQQAAPEPAPIYHQEAPAAVQETRQVTVIEGAPAGGNAQFAPYQPETVVTSTQTVIQEPPPQPVAEAQPAVTQPTSPPHQYIAELHTSTSSETSRNYLGTRQGLEGAFLLSHYHYQEPDLPMELNGLKYSPELTANFLFPDPWMQTGLDNWFLSADGRFAWGPVDYKGTGEKNDNEDYFFDARLLGGHDFSLTPEIAASPYVGFGYRFLHDDLRGLTSTGAAGYRRISQYVYLPLGATLRFAPFGDDSRISLNAEYDFLIFGTQHTDLTDAALATADIDNRQDDGRGIRASLMYETGNLSVGPFFNYWNVNQSELGCAGATCGFFEPHNETVEYGLKAAWRFWGF